MSVFLATGLRAGKAQPEDDEIIYKHMVPLPTAVRMAVSGTIRDAKTISSVLWLDHMSSERAEEEISCGVRAPRPSRVKRVEPPKRWARAPQVSRGLRNGDFDFTTI